MSAPHGHTTNSIRLSSVVATPFLVGGAVTVLAAAANVFWLAKALGVGRVRSTILFSVFHSFTNAAGGDFFRFLPAFANEPFDLASSKALFHFMFLNIVSSLLLCWAVVLLALPLIVGLARLSKSVIDRRQAPWGWAVAYPLGVFVVASFPALLLLVDQLTKPLVRGKSLEITLVVVVLLFLGLTRVQPSPRRVFQFCSGLVVGALLAMTVAAGAAMGATFLRPSAVASAASSPARAPNILLVSIDSLRPDHLSCYGYDRQTTPTIDALAQEGVRFEAAVSPTTWTLPAHLTLLTSLAPEAHGVINDGLRLQAGPRSLAQVLWRRGYATAAFVSGPYLEAEYGFIRGFDHYDDYTVTQPTHEESHRGITSPGLFHLVSRWLADWDRRGQQRPFFLFLHMWDVHYDYTPPPPYDSLYDPDYQGSVTGENFEKGTQVHAGMDSRDLQHVVALYDGEIRFTDEYLGKITAEMRSLGILDRTIIVVTSDHGDEFFEHGNKAHRKALYDETLLVPLVIRYPPSVPAGHVVRQQVRLMDVAPTILHLAGVTPPADFGSPRRRLPQVERDLTPLLLGETGPDTKPVPAYGDLHGQQFSIRTESSKLILGGKNPEAYELYDLLHDPGERTNLADSNPALASVLSKQLNNWLAVWGLRAGHSQQLELSDEQKERLRSLGYIE